MPLTANSPIRRRWAYIITGLAVGSLIGAVSALPQASPAQFYPGFGMIVVISSMLVGRTAGYLSVAMAALLLAFFDLKGEGFAVSDPWDALGLVLFVLFGIATVALAAAARDRVLITQRELVKAQSAAETNAQLLAEFTHRLMNDLNSLVFIAHLRARDATSIETKAALEDLGDRVEVIAQIYNRLRLSQNLGGEVDVGVFVRDLCDDFRRAHLELRPISLEVEVQVHTLALRRAIVVGFVLNELLTNATKYGFRDDVSGAIVVRFLSGPAGQLVLRVEDSGDGLGSDDAPKGTGIGQRIVRSMASQLHGAFSLEREGGWTVAELAFPAADSEP